MSPQMSTCIGLTAHNGNIRDICLHYFGCLREAEREEFFDTLNPHQQRRIKTEEQHISRLRALFDNEEEGTEGIARPFKVSLSRWRADYGNRHPGVRRDKSDEEVHHNVAYKIPCKDNGCGLYANMMFFHGSRPHTIDGYPDQFPHQRISIEDLLDNKDALKNPLMRKCEEDEFRYFHFPANNMQWVEVRGTIWCYYH